MNDAKARIAPTNEQLQDLDTIARRLSIAVKSVRRLIDRGELGCYRVGRLLRVSEAQYQEYLAGARHGRP